jgi:hypothetical protein
MFASGYGRPSACRQIDEKDYLTHRTKRNEFIEADQAYRSAGQRTSGFRNSVKP